MTEIWSYLAHAPLLWLASTLLAFVIGQWIFSLTGQSPLANPAVIAMILLAFLLHFTGTPFATYFEGAQFVHFLLGPATVCLALPLYDNLARIRQAGLPLLGALIVGSTIGIGGALGLAWAMGVKGALLTAIAPKAATAAVAIGIAEKMNGSPTLTALMVTMTGVSGALIATPLLNLLRIRDLRARGFALGVASHGFGTARALQVNQTAGAFAGLGMGLNALLTAILAPIFLQFFL